MVVIKQQLFLCTLKTHWLCVGATEATVHTFTKRCSYNTLVTACKLLPQMLLSLRGSVVEKVVRLS